MNAINTQVLVVPFKYLKHKTKLIGAGTNCWKRHFKNKTKCVQCFFCGQRSMHFFYFDVVHMLLSQANFSAAPGDFFFF